LVYLRLCSTDEIQVGKLRQFIAKGTEILVVNVNNKFFCLGARCTHAGAPLSEGELNGNVLTCPWHGSRFNVIDGSVVRGPAVKPLTVYRSIVTENHLLVEFQTGV
jgi:nitrite reductase/ring-hydroxylating ferredoxin subunit